MSQTGGTGQPVAHKNTDLSGNSNTVGDIDFLWLNLLVTLAQNQRQGFDYGLLYFPGAFYSWYSMYNLAYYMHTCMSNLAYSIMCWTEENKFTYSLKLLTGN